MKFTVLIFTYGFWLSTGESSDVSGGSELKSDLLDTLDDSAGLLQVQDSKSAASYIPGVDVTDISDFGGHSYGGGGVDVTDVTHIGGHDDDLGSSSYGGSSYGADDDLGSSSYGGSSYGADDDLGSSSYGGSSYGADDGSASYGGSSYGADD